MQNAPDPEYDDTAIRFLEALWGEGYLSPGGAEEVDRVLAGVPIAGHRVLDLGCGAGGNAVRFATDLGAAHVIGVDVELPVLARAEARAAAASCSDQVDFILAAPGPLPVSDGSVDIVFSKDAMVHIADKETLFTDIFRVLRPGGVLAAGDWLTSHDDTPSAAMQRYLAAEGLSFGMASADRYRRAMTLAGFQDVTLTDRNAWYRDVARGELERLRGPLYDVAAAAVGPAYVDKNILTWQAMLVVLDSGEHRPTHLRARKPIPEAGR